ncbi:hypothetical protein, partial [Lysinibacillus sp. 54212]|uniref:hypothetical protein n=1 Tax=Lysinibacillus sp. 54212 TaxID=3119829 RepID=UPI002FC9AFE5
GCGSMNTNDSSGTNSKEKEPQTLALQDEFTSRFLTSSKEVQDGYYELKSGIDGYTLLFPVNATLDQTFYQYRDQEYEAIYFWEDREKENYGYFVKGRFEDRKITQLIDSNLDLLIGSEKSLAPEDFEKYEIEENDVYFAEFKQNIIDNEKGYYLHFLGYVKSQTSDKAIALSYSSTCISETEECKLKLDQERERAKKIFHSVRFNP